jgi:hypothetical protein
MTWAGVKEATCRPPTRIVPSSANGQTVLSVPYCPSTATGRIVVASEQRYAHRLYTTPHPAILPAASTRSFTALNTRDTGKLTVRQGSAIARDVSSSIALDRHWRGKADETLVPKPSTTRLRRLLFVGRFNMLASFFIGSNRLWTAQLYHH